MRRIQNECINRGITRLCHFTQSRNLAHIFGDCTGVLSRRTLENSDMPHNPTDPDRYDGRDDLVCCSLEYPNTYYFVKVRQQDRLFKDWVVLLIDPKYLWQPDTRFCSCNAATARGAYIGRGYNSFISMFAQSVHGISFTRPARHLACSPTNIQAEVLVPDPIGLEDITAVVVADENQAKRELCRANLQGLDIDKEMLIIPEFFDRRQLARFIQNGNRVAERKYNNGGHHGL